MIFSLGNSVLDSGMIAVELVGIAMVGAIAYLISADSKVRR